MKYLKGIGIALAVIIIILFSGFFLFRGQLLQIAVGKVQQRLQERYHTALTLSSVEFTGFNHITARHVVLLPEGEDTLLSVSEADVDVALLPLLRGHTDLAGLKVNGVRLTIYHTPDRDNLTMLNVGRDTTHSGPVISTGFCDRLERLESRLFRILGTSFLADNVRISYEDTLRKELVQIPHFFLTPRDLTGVVIDQLHVDTLIVAGTVISSKKEYEVEVTHVGNDTAYLPFLDSDRGLRCRFQYLKAHVNFDEKGDDARVSVLASARDFHLHYWRLANDDVVLPEASLSGMLRVSGDAIELDSASTIRLSHTQCGLFARYDVKPDTTFALHVRMAETPADSFFQSLPGGMFGTLQGISCKGSLRYDLDFLIHTNNPDSLLFNSALTKKDLQIVHYGAENYARINGDFVYDAYDKDRLVRRITVGPDNPFFTRLDQISPYLPQAVLQAEDPFFMHHRGFLQESFRESIAKNYKEHRFARGGSTISMQLVKNVYLSRDKTISRKAEEALIVYLIENLGLVPKERMLEVYLNLIEWGPNVYGIGEAAHFYFNKRPSQLTLQESLFLASIIPRPKSFAWQFDRQGQLRFSLSNYFKILTERMVIRNVLAPEDTVGLKAEVTLRGPAMRMVMPADSLPQDTPDDE